MLERIKANSIFHVHTARCQHASDESDEEYIKKAIELGADSIVFTDHIPYPDDIFPNRMLIGELSGYIEDITALKEKYKGIIEVQLGLEVEYFPSLEWFYKELKADERIDLLIVGQHFYEHEDGSSSYHDSREVKKEKEWIGQFDAMIQAARSGYFSVIAHPDRSFRAREDFDDAMKEKSEILIREAISRGIALEQNLTSMRNNNYFWPEFWKLAKDISEEMNEKLYIVYGFDAHSTFEIEIGRKIISMI